MAEQIGKFDALQVYFGDDLVVNKYITLRQPTIGQMIEIGEENYWALINTLTAIPSDVKSMLWDSGIDWMMMSDLELFAALSPSLDKKLTSIIFGDIDFSGFRLLKRDNGELIFANQDGVVIDRYIHSIIVQYLCQVHRIKKKPEFAYNKITKQVLIDEDRKKRKRLNTKPFKSEMLPLISSLVNSPGFKYKLQEVRQMHIFEFMDSVSRIQLLFNTTGLINGFYSGNIDTDKFNTDKLNFMRDLYEQ